MPINKAAYSVLGINIEGQKDILGIWIGESESASFWLSVCNDLKNRGVENILIVCKDGLSGFSEAINTVFPQTEIQLCVIHQIRNSLKYVPHKDQKTLMADLKKVYQALTIEETEIAFAAFKEKWNKNTQSLSDPERTIGLTKTTYPTDDALRKIIYLATVEASKKWTVPIRDWKGCISQFAIYFGDRLKSELAI